MDRRRVSRISYDHGETCVKASLGHECVGAWFRHAWERIGSSYKGGHGAM